jgi:hypothetical protein
MNKQAIKLPELPPHLRSTMPEQVQSELRSKLLSCGGQHVAFYGAEPQAQALIEHGRLFTEPVELRRGALRQCHANAARLWERAPTKTGIVTGYARNEIGWLPHSLVLKDGVLLETTFEMHSYFGVELDDLEAVKFWFENFHIKRYPDQPPPPSYWTRRKHILKLLEEFMAKLRPTAPAGPEVKS